MKVGSCLFLLFVAQLWYFCSGLDHKVPSNVDVEQHTRGRKRRTRGLGCGTSCDAGDRIVIIPPTKKAITEESENSGAEENTANVTCPEDNAPKIASYDLNEDLPSTSQCDLSCQCEHGCCAWKPEFGAPNAVRVCVGDGLSRVGNSCIQSIGDSGLGAPIPGFGGGGGIPMGPPIGGGGGRLRG